MRDEVSAPTKLREAVNALDTRFSNAPTNDNDAVIVFAVLRVRAPLNDRLAVLVLLVRLTRLPANERLADSVEVNIDPPDDTVGNVLTGVCDSGEWPSMAVS